MKKVEFTNKRIFKAIIEYILCLLLVEFVIVGIAIIKLSNNSVESSSYFETANINAIQTKEEQPSNNFKYEIVNNTALSFYIKVNLKSQRVTVYTLDENGDYTIPIKRMVCSTGEYTPEDGVYSLSDRFEWAYLVGNVYGQYATRITGPILFHSVPYTKRSKSSLEYWEYDKLGQPVSKGCVRLTVEDAEWIFKNCKFGTKVEFCSDEEKDNVLVKKPMVISNYDEELRGWDPTDSDSDNPWKKYLEKNKGDVE